jgi:cytoskeletal protein RodZ
MTQDETLDAQRAGAEPDISIGREIRRAREVRGISIQQIAQETKINERYLHALENDRLDLLPGQPYTGNFVRAIARTIGADEEELLDYLNYQLKIQQPRGVEAAERRSDAERSRPLVMAALAMRQKPQDATPPPRPTAASTAPAPAATTAPAATADPGPAPDVAGATAARPAPPVMAGAEPPASPPPVAEGEAGPAPVLKLTFRGSCWVEINQQGMDKPDLGIHHAGDELTYSLDRPVTVTVNNAGNVSLSIDGQDGKPLGDERESRTLVIDRRNYRVFLR